MMRALYRIRHSLSRLDTGALIWASLLAMAIFAVWCRRYGARKIGSLLGLRVGLGTTGGRGRRSGGH